MARAIRLDEVEPDVSVGGGSWTGIVLAVRTQTAAEIAAAAFLFRLGPRSGVSVYHRRGRLARGQTKSNCKIQSRQSQNGKALVSVE